MEYRLEDGTRVDILFPSRACEIDWDYNWAEAVGQSTYYGLKTGRPALVILLVSDDDYGRHRDRVEFCGIECWIYDTRSQKFLSR